MRNFRKHSGIALIEALITTIILAVGLLAFVSFQSTITRHYGGIEDRTQALLIAQGKMGELRSIAEYVNINSSAPAAVPGTKYILGWTVTPTMLGDLEYKTIDVTVSWTDRKNQQQQLSLTSIISELDPFALGDILKTG